MVFNTNLQLAKMMLLMQSNLVLEVPRGPPWCQLWKGKETERQLSASSGTMGELVLPPIVAMPIPSIAVEEITLVLLLLWKAAWASWLSVSCGRVDGVIYAFHVLVL